MKTTRSNTFETNSSSTHAISLNLTKFMRKHDGEFKKEILLVANDKQELVVDLSKGALIDDDTFVTPYDRIRLVVALLHTFDNVLEDTTKEKIQAALKEALAEEGELVVKNLDKLPKLIKNPDYDPDEDYPTYLFESKGTILDTDYESFTVTDNDDLCEVFQEIIFGDTLHINDYYTFDVEDLIQLVARFTDPQMLKRFIFTIWGSNNPFSYEECNE